MLQLVTAHNGLHGQDMILRLKTVQRYHAILEVNRAALSKPGLHEILGHTYSVVKELIPCDRMALSLYAPEVQALQLAAAAGQGPASFYQVGLMLDCKESHHGWVFEHKKPLVRRDLEEEMQFCIEQPNAMEGVRSYCAVPLIVREHSLGVMIALSSERNVYSEQHAEFLQEVADQLTLAVKSLMPSCPQHPGSKLMCPRCIASRGGQATAGKHKMHLSEWGKKGGRGRRKGRPEA